MADESYVVKVFEIVYAGHQRADKLVHIVGEDRPMPRRTAERVERGMTPNLNHERYYTKIARV